jgi:hypothetical protein
MGSFSLLPKLFWASDGRMLLAKAAGLSRLYFQANNLDYWRKVVIFVTN